MARGLDPLLVAAFDAQAANTTAWLAGLTGVDLDRRSRLPGWRVAEVVAHLVQGPTAYTDALSAPRPLRGAKPLPVGAYTGQYAAGADEIAARETVAAQELSGDTARARFTAVVELAQSMTADLAGTDPVVAARRGPIRASDLLRTRVLELVVHALDVDGGPTRDREAVRVCVRLFAEILLERHGGKAIEVRVPPYAAVQIGAGVTHTRGTPPNVVECAPEVFVALASGRRPWLDAVAAGEVRASGSRADLREFLPVL